MSASKGPGAAGESADPATGMLSAGTGGSNFDGTGAVDTGACPPAGETH